MTPLSDLIARLEATKRGNQKLGDKVLLACGWKTSPNFDRNNPQPYWIRPDGQNVATNRPDPTTSLDAALTLVPKEYEQNWDLKWRNGAVCRAELYRPSYQTDALAATPALALCVAALKAREAR